MANLSSFTLCVTEPWSQSHHTAYTLYEEFMTIRTQTCACRTSTTEFEETNHGGLLQSLLY